MAELRDERGASGLAGWIGALVVVGALVAVPTVLLMRQQTTGAQDDLRLAAGATDASAQALLSTAVQGAQAWLVEHGSLDGYGPAQAASFEPQTAYDASPTAREGRVSVRGGSGDAVVFASMGGTGPLCAALHDGTVSYGRVDAASPDRCAGPGWG
jgi:hypothetical protein